MNLLKLRISLLEVLTSFRRDARVAEGAPLLREYVGKTASRVRIPLSPPKAKPK